MRESRDAFLGQVSQVACHNMYPAAIDDDRGAGAVPLPLNQGQDFPRPSRAACMADPQRFSYTTDV